MSERKVTISKEVLFNMGHYENVKIGVSISSSAGGKGIIDKLTDAVDEALAVETEAMGRDPKDYGFR